MNRGRRGCIAGIAGAAIAVTAAGAARDAGADELELAVGHGRVTLAAADVPLGDVLAEWARVGGTRFEGVGELGAAPVSLHLEGVAEREALRLLLRPAAGFLAAPRAPDVSGASIYDRVKILAGRRASHRRRRLRRRRAGNRRPDPYARRRRCPRRTSASGCSGCCGRARWPRR